MAELQLWYYIHGKLNFSSVSILPNETIEDVKEKIYKKNNQSFPGCNAPDLILTKVDVDLDEIVDGQYNPNTNGQSLRPHKRISDVWPESPPKDRLHVYIRVDPTANHGSPTLVHNVGGPIGHVDLLQDYNDIFMNVNEWGMFEESDLDRNQIRNAEYMMITPDFVTTFEQELVRKPRLTPSDAYLQALENLQEYFELPEDSIAEDESHEEARYAGLREVSHTACHISLYNWEEAWKPCGKNRHPLKGHVSESIFFDPLVYTPKNRTATTQKNKSCPITLVVRRGEDEETRRYNPHSDFLISHSSLPRLLVEVNSTSEKTWPMDLVRMLTTGAFIVRFANHFLNAFRQEKSFVLCAIFIWDDGHAARFTLFQQQNDEAVHYREKTLSLNDSVRRVEFVRHLYNLLCIEVDEDEDRDTNFAVCELNNKIASLPMKSMYTKQATAGKTGRKRAHTNNGDRAGGADEDDRAQLRAHGYEVKPEVIVDASGGEWAPLYKRPDHILTVYRPMDSKRELIAKKVRNDSNELEILSLLDTIPLKSDHVISLIDSFHGWAILPKMATVKSYVEFGPKLSESKVTKLCVGLIKGLGYLHEHRIAHRDIKPDNLLVNVNENFCLKIIDFDIAMRVEDEDEEVDDQCGTKNWMAPEVEKKLRHSPIKADRWSCGRVMLYLLDKFKKEDKHLRPFANKLMAHNPELRPSLALEWASWSDAPLLNVANLSNAGERKALLQPFQRKMVVGRGRENTPPPEAKETRQV